MSCGGPAPVAVTVDAGSDAPTDAPTSAEAATDAPSESAPSTCTTSFSTTISAVDAYAYPPYAIDGCTVLWVTADGQLLQRSLLDGKQAALAPPTETPSRPTLAGDLRAWEAIVGGVSVVRVRGADGVARTMSGAFHHAGEPRAASDGVIFTGFADDTPLGDSDVYFWRASSDAVERLTKTPGQQRFPDASAGLFAWTDFSEDPLGAYHDDGTDLADIVVQDRATGVVTPRLRPGKQAFPAIADVHRVVYLTWSSPRPEPKLIAYSVRVADLSSTSSTDPVVVDLHYSGYVPARPQARGGRVAWVQETPTGLSLSMRPADLSAAARSLGPAARDYFSPALGEGRVLLGTRSPAGTPMLELLAE